MGTIEQRKSNINLWKTPEESQFFTEIFRDRVEYVDLPLLLRHYAEIIHDYTIGYTVFYALKDDEFKNWRRWGNIREKGFPPHFSVDRRYRVRDENE